MCSMTAIRFVKLVNFSTKWSPNLITSILNNINIGQLPVNKYFQIGHNFSEIYTLFLPLHLTKCNASFVACLVCMHPLRTKFLTQLSPPKDLELTTKPKICTTCSQEIEKFYNFKNSCLETESKVRNYLDTHCVPKKDSKVDLIDVVQSNGLIINVNLDFNTSVAQTQNSSKPQPAMEVNEEDDDAEYNKYVLDKTDSNSINNDVVLFSCNICSYMTTDDAKLKDHKCFPESKKRQMMSMIRCNQCEFLSPTPKILEDHKSEAHPVWYSCNHCAFKTKFINVMTKHKNTAHANFQNSSEHMADCKLCPYRAINTQFLQKHVRAMHYRPPPILSCTMCSYETSDRSNFKKHQYIHTKDKPHKCPTCIYQCVSPYQMKKHVEKQHSDKKEFSYTARNK